jgi:tripartite-type tricarboxylate transporter receptor subunit TctC
MKMIEAGQLIRPDIDEMLAQKGIKQALATTRRPLPSKGDSMSSLSLLLKVVGLLITIVLTPGLSLAAQYPAKPVRIVVAMAPGGSNDMVGRLIAAKLTDRLGKQVIVENRGGAGGVIGAESVAKAEPDGYTLLLISGSHVIQPALQKLPYDPIRSYTPIARIGTGTNALVVHPSVPVTSLKELIALAKQHPGQVIFATGGVGGTPHMAAELLSMMAGIQVKMVHFKGGGPAMTDLLGGHSQAMFGTLIQLVPHIKSGAFRVLGTGGVKRSQNMPDVPTIAEAGVPGYSALGWWGLVAPAGTPAPVIDRLNQELKAVLAMDDVKDWFIRDGAEADYLGPAEFGKFLEEEVAKWAQVVSTAGIKAE